ncbi:hypothetical protein MKW92_005149 [Papaver armeniacum]|nr:hypothetical protein MKW92_005149 [Papaver armeniacum]
MKHDLSLVGCVEFREEDYPGYRNKKGSGPECNEPFHLGECSTFKFKFFHYLKKSASGYIHSPLYQIHPQVQNLPLRVPLQTYNANNPTTTRHQVKNFPSQPQNQILFDVGYPLVEVPSNFWYFGSPYTPRIMGYRIWWLVHETLRNGFERYMVKAKE